jgi:hypothetical protein
LDNLHHGGKMIVMKLDGTSIEDEAEAG